MFSPSNPFRSSQPPQDSREQQTYLPPGIKRAMKEYEQNSQGQGPQVVSPTSAEPPQSPQVTTPQTVAPPVEPQAPNPDQPYSFITDPPKPPKESFLSGLGGGSMAMRIALIVGVLVLFIIIIAVFKNISGRSGTAEAVALVSVAQDQQELLHLVSETASQASLSTTHQNFSVTLQLSVSSSQSQLVNYLTNGGKKLSAKQINLKVSSTIDNQLSAALTTNTLDQTFQQVMQTQLSNYGKDLQKAYALDKGPKARALLKDSYDQAVLLSSQLNQPNT